MRFGKTISEPAKMKEDNLTEPPIDARPGDEQDRVDMTRLAAGHHVAMNDLMERHAQKLFHYLIRSLQDEAEAADLAQEAFVRVYQNRAKFRENSSFSVWLYAIASNLVRDRFRWRARRAHVSLEAENNVTGDSLRETLADQGAIPSESLQGEERAAAVREALAALPEELRLPLILAEYEEKSQAEIAAIFNCSVKAVETRIYRARHKLRVCLEGLLTIF